ncbi:MAG: DUF4270 family protein [Bacteroidia bacterium]
MSRAIGTKFFLFLSIIGATLSLTSCDESSVVGLDVQPANDLLHVGWIDTTTLLTKTIKEDSLRTDGLLVSNGVGLIGKYYDPTFGITWGAMYTQMRLPTNITTTSNFGINPVCDSLILYLVYDPLTYGERPRVAQTLNVYELSTGLSTSATYYSNDVEGKYTLDLTAGHAGYSFIPRPLDSINNIYTTPVEPKLIPQLRVPMDNTLGQMLLNNGSAGTTSTYLTDDGLFRDFFKGLYITTENTPGLTPGQGNIMRFLMGVSKLTVYYHNSNATQHDSLHYDFSLGSVARFNHFHHDYSTGIDVELNTQLTTAPAQNTTTFIQSMAGVKTKVQFPYLMNWVKSGPISINKAELVIRVDSTVNTFRPPFVIDSLAPPTDLIIYGIEDDGVTPFLIPDAFEGTSYFGGSFNTTSKQYSFNIARYIQQILDGKRLNNGIYVLASNGAAYANRVVVGGGGPGPLQMKLNITYTKIH